MSISRCMLASPTTREGNKYQVQAFGRGTNFHALWDTGLIEEWGDGTPTLLSALSRARAPAADASVPAQWAADLP